MIPKNTYQVKVTRKVDGADVVEEHTVVTTGRPQAAGKARAKYPAGTEFVSIDVETTRSGPGRFRQ